MSEKCEHLCDEHFCEKQKEIISAAIAFMDQLDCFNRFSHPEVLERAKKLQSAVGGYLNEEYGFNIQIPGLLNKIQMDLLSSFLVGHWREISKSEHRVAFERILEILNPGALQAEKKGVMCTECRKVYWGAVCVGKCQKCGDTDPDHRINVSSADFLLR